MINTLKSQFPSLNVLKEFPESGQKWVYLIELEPYGKVMLKIAKSMDERIQREINLLKNTTIKGIPTILDSGVFEYKHITYTYYFEEYIEGSSLSDIFQSQKLPVQKTLILLEDLLVTVVELEKHRIIHRDIKPDNIMCTPDGHFRLIDFGIARDTMQVSLTGTGAAIGPHTPGYGAPELFQYNKPMIDSRADLFSIGIVSYQAFFNRHPFLTGNEEDLIEIWYKTKTVMPVEYHIYGDVTSQMSGFVQTLMQKQISRRPPNAQRALAWFYTARNSMDLE